MEFIVLLSNVHIIPQGLRIFLDLLPTSSYCARTNQVHLILNSFYD